MDGIAFAKWALTEAPDLKVVFVSGHPDNREGAQKIGFYLAKPFNVSILAEVVVRFIV